MQQLHANKGRQAASNRHAIRIYIMYVKPGCHTCMRSCMFAQQAALQCGRHQAGPQQSQHQRPPQHPSSTRSSTWRAESSRSRHVPERGAQLALMVTPVCLALAIALLEHAVPQRARLDICSASLQELPDPHPQDVGPEGCNVHAADIAGRQRVLRLHALLVKRHHRLPHHPLEARAPVRPLCPVVPLPHTPVPLEELVLHHGGREVRRKLVNVNRRQQADRLLHHQAVGGHALARQHLPGVVQVDQAAARVGARALQEGGLQVQVLEALVVKRGSVVKCHDAREGGVQVAVLLRPVVLPRQRVKHQQPRRRADKRHASDGVVERHLGQVGHVRHARAHRERAVRRDPHDRLAEQVEQARDGRPPEQVAVIHLHYIQHHTLHRGHVEAQRPVQQAVHHLV
mmetsp:Transcript_18243/g.46023  ORF Transcript_18243/g.46023 Transcript_18243/m.46023 type:complete len:400 (-) Transcript_18243:69-1268(-)